MDWLTLHITTGAAVASNRLGKGYILLEDDKTLNVNFEESGEMDWKPDELQDTLNGQILNDEPVTIWFQPKTETSVSFDVPITDWTYIQFGDGSAYDAGAFEKEGVLQRVNQKLKDNYGWYSSGP